MASSSADCVLGGVRLISSASRMLPKIGPWHEGPAAMPGGGIFLDDVRAGDVRGHQVRRELDALENQAERLRNRADHQRLRRAGKARDQAVAADEQRDENLIEHFVLADDDLADLREDAVAHRLESDRCASSVPRSRRLTSAGVAIGLFPFLGVLELQEQFLGRAIIGAASSAGRTLSSALSVLAVRRSTPAPDRTAPKPDREGAGRARLEYSRIAPA